MTVTVDTAPSGDNGRSGVRMKQVLAWALLFLSYVSFYVCRKNYAFWLQDMMRVYGATAAQVGLLGSVFELSFGAGKVFGGVVVDVFDPSLVLGTSLALSALCNFALSTTNNFTALAAINCLHGGLQSLGWPALAKVLLVLFPKPSERGRWYSFLSVSQNVGSGLTPLVVTASVSILGWRGSMIGPATVSLAASAVVYMGLRLTIKPSKPETASSVSSSNIRTSSSPPVGSLLFSAPLLCLGASCLLISTIRVTFSTWLPVYMSSERGLDASDASWAIMAMEAGGFVAGISCGFISDVLFRGDRAAVIASSAVGLYWSLLAFVSRVQVPGAALLLEGWVSPEAASVVVSCFFVGLTAFPIHVLVGLAAREIVPLHVAGTAGSLVKAMGQVGSFLAGYTMAKVVEASGWPPVETMSILAPCAMAVLMIPVWRARTSLPKDKRS